MAASLSLVLVLGGILSTPMADMALTPVPGFMTAFGAGMVVINLMLAALLLSKGSIERRADAVRLGTAYLFVGTIFIPLLLSFKDGFVPGTIIGTPASSVWLWSFWHGGFASGIAWYAINVRSKRSAPSLAALGCCVVGAVGALALLATSGIDYLPALLVNGGTFFFGRLEWIPTGLILLNLGALLLCLRLKARTTEQLWVTVAMVASCFDLWLTVQGTNRFALGWYLSKCGSLVTSLVVITSLFHDIARLYRSSVESEARYRLLADASSDMVSRIDRDGRHRYVSPAVTEILGYDAAELIGTRPVDFIHPDDACRIASCLKDMGESRNDQARDIHRFRHKAGHWVWAEVQLRLARNRTTGAPIEIVSNLRDVTERETLQHRLKEANRLLLMAEEVAHVGHWRLELPGNDLTWSEEVYRIHGVDPENFVLSVETALSFYPPDDRALVANYVNQARASRKGYTYTLRICRPDGALRHVQSRGLCESDPDTGELCAIFGALMDVTDLVQAEMRVSDKSELLQATLDAMEQALIKVAADGTIELVNRRFAEILDIPADLLGCRAPILRTY